MIKLYFSAGRALVWDAEDVYFLRKEHKIIGSLVGCYPVKLFQIQTKWLPLQLSSEETKLLLEKGIAQLVSSPETITDGVFIENFSKHRDTLCDEQITLLKQSRQHVILEKADEIYEGKKRKFLENVEKNKKLKQAETSDSTPKDPKPHENSPQDKVSNAEQHSNSSEQIRIDDIANRETHEKNDELLSDNQEFDVMFDKDAIIAAELAKVSNVSKDLCCVQLFTECLYKKSCDVINWMYPTSDKERIKFAVFKDLWEKHFYVTSGSKFGGDFLAYEGDPFKYHALYIVVCMHHTETIQGSDIVMYGRLGHQVKKTVALATVNKEGKVDYMSLTWANEVP